MVCISHYLTGTKYKWEGEPPIVVYDGFHSSVFVYHGLLRHTPASDDTYSAQGYVVGTWFVWRKNNLKEVPLHYGTQALIMIQFRLL